MTDYPHEHEPDTGLQRHRPRGVRPGFRLHTRRSTAPRCTPPTKTGASSTVSAPKAPVASTAPSGTSSESKRGKATDAGCSRPAPYSDTGARPVLDTGASDLSKKEPQRTRTGREGPKQGGNDFPKAPCLPKLDRIRPSFGQGAKGAKGAFFEKTFSLREHPTHLS